ncbi:scavenger receptor class b, member 2 [Plakobranchus ocellatus]|uniref:Scavenger receptor class b, member 2 n=1 Tax=Plakobranchus ocellatus TaxID=259542 RepID=A0AAV4BYS6_9GAST|nr:scavenger receptor class b, member 2 [Plakobranchus ocellatus]
MDNKATEKTLFLPPEKDINGYTSMSRRASNRVPKKRTYKRWGISMILMLIVGLIMAAIGGAMFPVVDHIIREQVKERVIISNTSETYEIWQDVPVPVYMQFYMFNIGNPEEVIEGKTPYLEQIGPFTYRERRVKFDIVWNDNSTVTYKQNRTFEFIPEMSVGKEDTKITTINPLIATIAQNMQYLNGFVKTAISLALSSVNEDIIMTRPVHEVLWGYNDQALSFLNRFDAKAFPTKKIGYFIRKNYTDDGVYTVNTGETDIHRLAFIERYNGADSLDMWTTSWANMVNGTDGTVGPPFRFDAEVSPVFVSDICRSIKGIYRENVKTPQGIELRRFGGDRRDMENATMNPDNIGFCTPQTNCLPSGLLNSTLCQEPVDGFELPVIFSFPHFLFADQSVQESVVGLNPVQHEHETVIDQEPWTGLVLQVAKRLQINMYVQQVAQIGQTHKIQTLFFPILWLNESSVVDDHWASKLQDELFTPMNLAHITKIGLLVIGGFMVVFSAVMLVWRRHLMGKARESWDEPNSSPSSKDAVYDKPVEDDGRASVISNISLEDGRNSVDAFDGNWYDPAGYEEDGNDSTSGNLHRNKDTEQLLKS